MTKRKFRTLEELYGVSEEVSEAKITPVLKGGYQIQGPADEAESIIQGSCQTEGGFSGHFSSTKEKSGMCNACATPCSSCMHFDCVSSLVGKMNDFSDEGCLEKITSQCFSNDAELYSPCKSSSSDVQQHITSKTSNFLSGCSSHDSFSGNAESKVTLKASHISKDIEVGQSMVEDSGLPNPSTFCGKRIFSNPHKRQKGSECLGDGISSISTVHDPIGDFHGEGDRKYVSYSSASVNSSPVEVATVSVGPTPNCLGDPFECFGEKVESSCARLTTTSVGGQKPAIPNCVRSVKSDIDLDDKRQETEVLRFLDKKEHSKSAFLLTSCPLQSQLADDNAKLDVLKYEVKVCDICGHPGREELLATCKKCGDSAEHIYCMHIKLEKVPEQWMCEECIVKEETKKEMKGTNGFLEGSSLNQTRKNSGNSSISNFENYLEFGSMDSTVPECRRKRLDSATQFFTKRAPECLETVPVMKRTLETITRSTNLLSPCEKNRLSCHSSIRNMCKGKVKPANDTSCFRDHSSNNITMSVHKLPKISQQPQMSRDFLLKSNSFHVSDSDMKGKLPEKYVHWKQTFKRETDTRNMKKGVGRIMSKSLSLNDYGSKRLDIAQSKVKMHVEDLRRSQHAKQNSLWREHKSRSDYPHIVSPVAASSHSAPTTNGRIASRCETVLAHSSVTSCNELKSLRFYRNCNNSSESTSQLASKDLKRSQGQGVIGAKRSNLCLSDVHKDPSPGTSNYSHEPKPNESIAEVVLTSGSSLPIDRRKCISGAVLQESHKGKFSKQEEQSRIICSFSQSRLKISVGSGSAHCLRCKGIGHYTDSCPTMTSQVPQLAARNSKEVNNSKMGDLVKAAIVGRDELHTRSSCPNQSNELSMSSSNMNCKISTSDCLSRHSTWMVDPFSAKETNEGQIGVAKDMRWHTRLNTQVSYTIQVENSNSIVPCDEKLYVRNVPRFASVFFPSRIPAVPELDNIWQGGFEVHRKGSISSSYTGIQAHLSTCASKKVLEVVHMLPPKITLEEVPRLSTWPAQFLDNYATEDNIALYFFAGDLERYETDYKYLLEYMIKNDLALKGNLKGIELLIFSSDLLLKKSQRWNALSFLWGVFRVRSTNYTDQVPASHTQVSISCLNALPPDQNVSLTTSRHLFESLAATKTAPLELQHIYSGRTSFDQKLSRVSTLSYSSVPIEGELFSNDILQNDLFLNEHRGHEGRLDEDPKTLHGRGDQRREGLMVKGKTDCVRAQDYFHRMYYTARDKQYLGDGYPSGANDCHCTFLVEDQRCQGAHSIEIAEKLRIMGVSTFSASGSVDPRLETKFSRQQVPSIDDEEQTKSEHPNLELSLGGEKKSAKQGMMPSFLRIVNKKNIQDEHPKPESNRKNSDGELSLSLSLGLCFPDNTNA